MQEGREALERWGFLPGPRENIHTFVRLRYTYARHADLSLIGRALDGLVQLRNQADYQLRTPGPFTSSQPALQAADDARDAIDLLDQINADPTRRSAAISAIRAAFP
jgi:hypothetical protein